MRRSRLYSHVVSAWEWGGLHRSHQQRAMSAVAATERLHRPLVTPHVGMNG